MTAIVFVDHVFPHHGAYSGYQRLQHYLDGAAASAGDWLRVVPRAGIYGIPGMHPTWYNRQALAAELRLLPSVAVRWRVIYHYLYGEHSFRLAGAVNSARHGNRIVASYHQPPRFFEARRRQFGHLRTLDAVILMSSNQRPFFESMVNPARVHVIPLGAETAFFTPAPALDTSARPLRVLTVGANYRDFDLHRRVVERVRQCAGRDVEFLLVGAGPAAYGPGAAQVCFRRGLCDADLLACYQAADLLLLPLADATACCAILEGMACGLPLVVTDVGGVRDYVDESMAVLVPPGDAAAMAAQVLALLGDAPRRRAMGQVARDRAVRRFAWPVVAQQIREVYARLW